MSGVNCPGVKCWAAICVAISGKCYEILTIDGAVFNVPVPYYSALYIKKAEPILMHYSSKESKFLNTVV